MRKTIISYNPYKNIDWDTVIHAKGEFHIHSNTDGGDNYGDLMPGEIANEFKDNDYKILCITDNDYCSFPWTDYDADGSYDEETGVYTFTDNYEMLSIKGSELKKTAHHITNINGDLCEFTGDIYELIDMARSKANTIIFTHPNYYRTKGDDYDCKWYLDQITKYPQYITLGLEVFNSGTYFYDEVRGDDLHIWDYLLARLMPRRFVLGLGVSDAKTIEQMHRGYSHILLDSLHRDSFVAAIRQGSAYISLEEDGTGKAKTPSLNKIEIDESKIIVDVEDADNIEWVYKGLTKNNGSYFEYKNFKGNYIRVRLENEFGATLLQPFGFERIKQ